MKRILAAVLIILASVLSVGQATASEIITGPYSLHQWLQKNGDLFGPAYSKIGETTAYYQENCVALRSQLGGDGNPYSFETRTKGAMLQNLCAKMQAKLYGIDCMSCSGTASMSGWKYHIVDGRVMKAETIASGIAFSYTPGSPMVIDMAYGGGTMSIVNDKGLPKIVDAKLPLFSMDITTGDYIVSWGNKRIRLSQNGLVEQLTDVFQNYQYKNSNVYGIARFFTSLVTDPAHVREVQQRIIEIALIPNAKETWTEEYERDKATCQQKEKEALVAASAARWKERQAEKEGQQALDNEAVRRGTEVFCDDTKVSLLFAIPEEFKKKPKNYCDTAWNIETYSSVKPDRGGIYKNWRGDDWHNYCVTLNRFSENIQTPDDARRALVLIANLSPREKRDDPWHIFLGIGRFLTRYDRGFTFDRAYIDFRDKTRSYFNNLRDGRLVAAMEKRRGVAEVLKDFPDSLLTKLKTECSKKVEQ
ncbi:MAG: hypothetical protein A4E57_02470 [Syntrophorhabdaceae bacterium PtaU1.Bin034]|jgi:hypothetical protein|nr:MAG: hypothetical protein A4E57_02470 [Syntrophorhabdaceae bacterium PtaU1.Bin034]